MKPTAPIIFVLLFSAITAFGAKQKDLIAVMDLKAQDVTESEAATVSEFLRSDLVHTKKFTVIERARLQDVLKEQQLAMAGLTEDAQAAQIGKILNCRFILVGSLSKLGNQYFLNVRVVNVETGETPLAERESAAQIEDLSYISKKIAQRLAGEGMEDEKASKQAPFGFDIGFGLSPFSLLYSETGEYGIGLTGAELTRYKTSGLSRNADFNAGLYISHLHIGFLSRTWSQPVGTLLTYSGNTNAVEVAPYESASSSDFKITTSDILLGFRTWKPGKLNSRVLYLSYHWINLTGATNIVYQGPTLGFFGKTPFRIGESSFDITINYGWQLGALFQKKDASYPSEGIPFGLNYSANFGIGCQQNRYGPWLTVGYGITGLFVANAGLTSSQGRSAVSHGLDIRAGINFDLQALSR
jgi:TolB-like protein